MSDKNEFLNLIKSNIALHGFHVTIVKGYLAPRYAYTIGLKDILGYELIFAGGIYYLKNELLGIFNSLVNAFKANPDLINHKVSITDLGNFSFSKTHSSWNNYMVLGVFDYFSIDAVGVLQIIPDADHYTKDIPDLTKAYSQSAEPIWQWLTRDWLYNIPAKSTVVTNIDSLRGQSITELMRWEEDEWEMFTGPGSDFDKQDMRVVSMATMIGIDDSLKDAIIIQNGKGLWREDENSNWNNWG